jgi:uncharacterized protein YbjQ (UPF0145 family)
LHFPVNELHFYKTTGMIVTTSTGLEGYRVVQHLGIVHGIMVRSCSILGNVVGGIQSLFGGNITIFTELCEKTRQQAYDLMIAHATHLGANAIINMRYDANDVMQGITEALAYEMEVVENIED